MPRMPEKTHDERRATEKFKINFSYFMNLKIHKLLANLK